MVGMNEFLLIFFSGVGGGELSFLFLTCLNVNVPGSGGRGFYSQFECFVFFNLSTCLT